MRVTTATATDFRNYARADVGLGERLTVLVGANGAGKTNLLEAIYFGCTGRSPRTSADRELLRRGAETARVTVATEAADGAAHVLEVGMTPGTAKSMRVDGRSVDNLSREPARPLVSVFLPERLELVKGAPAGRRAHLDQLVAALWPSRAETRAAYSRTLAQRNALIGRLRAGAGSSASLDAWDAELAGHGVALMGDRRRAACELAPLFAHGAARLGLPEDAELAYRPRSPAASADELAAELRERRDADVERGFTAHGPHRDDLRLAHGGVALRTYGSQGQQRTALLALLFAERELLLRERGSAPLMLLDDVMSELDSARRELLSELLRADGQSVLTTTELDHVPGGTGSGVVVVDVAAGTATARDHAQVERA